MNLFDAAVPGPLADRLRPQSLDEYVGQLAVVGDGQFVREMIRQGEPRSLILWGPPGTGKTTLARIIAKSSSAAFEELSAVTSGLPEVKKVIERASERHKLGGRTLLFVDEIHRFNKTQQDAFLPHVEDGTIILIGATTENPSFEVIRPLLSRSRVVVLQALSPEQLVTIIERGITQIPSCTIETEAVSLLAHLAAGDARAALSGLEVAASLTPDHITTETIQKAMQRPAIAYDKAGEQHYNVISALIKSLRGGAVDAALFYLARMLEGGEDPTFISRRLLIFAAEDVGLADPAMLTLATSTFMAIERIGMPEGRIVLSECVIALALAPKDRSAYDAIGRAMATVRANPAAEVPLGLRNAPTQLMKDQGYGEDYRWEAGFELPRGFMPQGLERERFYKPPS